MNRYFTESLPLKDQNRLRPYVTSFIAHYPHIYAQLAQFPRLHTLDLEDNSLSPETIMKVVETLDTNTTLTKLNLSTNKIGAAGEVIARALQTNTTLTKLKLMCCSPQPGSTWPAALIQALQTNTTLTWLNLIGNNIGVAGAERIGEALQTNRALTTLILDANDIGDEGVTQVAQALQTNTTLTDLGLYGNGISDEGVTQVAQALQTNTALTWLDLVNNKIEDAGAQALLDAIRNNVHLPLKSIDLGGNYEISRTLRDQFLALGQERELIGFFKTTSFSDLSTRQPF